MDDLQTSSCENDSKHILKFKENNEQFLKITLTLLKYYKAYNLHAKVVCGIIFKTDDGCITFGRENVFMAASLYFQTMFCNYFNRSNIEFVSIRKLEIPPFYNYVLVDYIYTGKLMSQKKMFCYQLQTSFS